MLSAAVMSLVCLAGASLVLPRIWHESPFRWWRRSSTAADGAARRLGKSRRSLRERLLQINPYFWLASYDRRIGFVWLLLGGAGFLWLWGYAEYKTDWIENGMCQVFSVCLHGMLKVWIVFAVVKRIGEDKRSGALEPLLSTPLRQESIFGGQFRSLARQFAGPVAALLVVEIVFWQLVIGQVYQDRGLTTLLFGAHGAMLLADVVALGWLGLWQAVAARHPTQAALNTISQILLAHWLLFVVLASINGILRLDFRYAVLRKPEVWVGLWLALGIAIDLFWALYARARLRRDFRSEAAQPFEAKGGWLNTLLYGR
jgi:hypothetical protein